mgnify:CR=1 FL=1
MLLVEPIVQLSIFLIFITIAQGYVRQQSNEDVAPPAQETNNRTGNIVLNFEASSNMGGIQHQTDVSPQSRNQPSRRTDPNNSYVLRGRGGADELDVSNNNDTTRQNIENENLALQQILKDFLLASIRWNVLCFFLLGFILLCIEANLSYIYPIAFLWSFDIYSIIQLVISPKSPYATR